MEEGGRRVKNVKEDDEKGEDDEERGNNEEEEVEEEDAAVVMHGELGRRRERRVRPWGTRSNRRGSTGCRRTDEVGEEGGRWRRDAAPNGKLSAAAMMGNRYNVDIQGKLMMGNLMKSNEGLRNQWQYSVAQFHMSRHEVAHAGFLCHSSDHIPCSVADLHECIPLHIIRKPTR